MKKKIISTENAPAAIGPYSQAVEVNGMLFLSGMLAIDPAKGDLVAGGVREQTTQIFTNIRAVLAVAGVTTEQIVKTTVFLQDMSLFGEMNEVYAAQFNGSFPARSAFAVKELPKQALVEIEVIAVR
ncbi:MAG: RidA family protein [Proteiniphilum sp.]|jgi:2-iminobutanoate/2-iminopropanoate deaminase|nr:RidA family protein [Proteiniphilum sp.]NCD14866.1 RidA family protein [Bacteroidia bacterium]MDD2725940.1 RidA family protein [Proteiniphilum sp.]MDD3331962.1 RidA family protein [Proteiniphilum sp.]MDD3556109.1 RidA family protein [Proteiniphilum sp.]